MTMIKRIGDSCLRQKFRHVIPPDRALDPLYRLVTILFIYASNLFKGQCRRAEDQGSAKGAFLSLPPTSNNLGREENVISGESTSSNPIAPLLFAIVLTPSRNSMFNITVFPPS